MPPVKSRAIVLRTHTLGETSRIVVCYTRDYGKVRLVAKGVRKGGGPLGAALEPMLVSGVVFYLREDRDLSIVSQAEIERRWPELHRDVVRMAYAGAALELVDALVPEREPDAGIFDLIERALDLVARAPEPALDGVLWWFELSMAAALGYGPHLGRCVVCGREAAGAGVFVPAQGGIVCESCAAGQGPLSDAARHAAGLLSGLVPQEAGPGSRVSEPQEPLPAGLNASGEVAAGARDEVTALLLAFLEEHAGRRLRLKSMDFLAQIRRTGPRTGGSE
jgi:DNA repair protein RecO (recombination protein O)